MRPASTHATRPSSFHHVSTCVCVYTRFRHDLSPPLPCAATSISFRSTRPTVCLNFSRSIHTVAKGKKAFSRGCAPCTHPRLAVESFVFRDTLRYEIWAGGCGWFVWKNWWGWKFVKRSSAADSRPEWDFCRHKFAGKRVVRKGCPVIKFDRVVSYGREAVGFDRTESIYIYIYPSDTYRTELIYFKKEIRWTSFWTSSSRRIIFSFRSWSSWRILRNGAGHDPVGRTVKVDLLKIDEKFAFIYRCQNSSISMEIRGPFLKTGFYR